MLLIKQVCVCTVISECWISARAANHRTCSSRTFIIAMRYCNLLFYCTPSGTPNFRWKLCNCALDGSSNSIISYACHLLLILKLAYSYSDGSFNSSHWIFYRTSSSKFSDTENPMNQICQCKKNVKVLKRAWSSLIFFLQGYFSLCVICTFSRLLASFC